MQGLQIIIYLDDGILAVAGRQVTKKVGDRVRQDLARAGLVENISKSKWEPSREITWLGFDLNLEEGRISISPGKIVLLISMLQSALNSRQIKAKLLASIIGKIISMALGLGNVS